MSAETRLPNLICPGAQKSGTTTLFAVLRQHPDIYLSTKEAHFFDIYYDRGQQFYADFFKEASDEKYLMDITPVYMMMDEIPGRIYKELGEDVRFVFILRNPVDRAYSAFDMRRSTLVENCSTFEEALEKEPERISGDIRSLITFSYKMRGYYAKQIRNFLEYFPIENMFFILFEDFIRDIEGESRKLLDFLGLGVPEGMDFNQWSNKSQYFRNPLLVKAIKRVKWSLEKLIPGNFIRDISHDKLKWLWRLISKKQGTAEKSVRNPDTCRALMADYEADILELEKIIGRDLSIWIDKYK